MKFFTTNEGLDYKEYGIFLHLNENQYLCVEIQSNFSSCMYEVGELYDLSDYISLMEIDYDIKDSPLNGTFLFNFLVYNVFNENQIEDKDSEISEEEYIMKKISKAIILQGLKYSNKI